MKVISNNVMFAFYVFVAFVAFTDTDSKQLEEDYTPLANNEQKGLYGLKYMFQEENRTQSNTQWGDINNPSY